MPAYDRESERQLMRLRHGIKNVGAAFKIQANNKRQCKQQQLKLRQSCLVMTKSLGNALVRTFIDSILVLRTAACSAFSPSATRAWHDCKPCSEFCDCFSTFRTPLTHALSITDEHDACMMFGECATTTRQALPVLATGPCSYRFPRRRPGRPKSQQGGLKLVCAPLWILAPLRPAGRAAAARQRRCLEPPWPQKRTPSRRQLTAGRSKDQEVRLEK